MSAADVNAMAVQAMGHVPTSPGSCDTPFGQLMSAVGKIECGGVSSLSQPAACPTRPLLACPLPAASCPPGFTKVGAPHPAAVSAAAAGAKAPIHPAAAAAMAQQQQQRQIGAAAGSPTASPSVPASSPAAPASFNDMHQFATAQTTRNMLNMGDLAHLSESERGKLQTVPFDLCWDETLHQLSEDPKKAVQTINADRIARGIQGIDPNKLRGRLLQILVTEQSGSKPVGVHINCNAIKDTSNHMVYSAKNNADALAWFAPNLDVHSTHPNGGVSRYVSSLDAPMREMLKFGGVSVDDMFKKEDCTLIDQDPSAVHYSVRIGTKEAPCQLANSMVLTATTEENQRKQDAARGSAATSEYIFQTHPRTWSIGAQVNGQQYWHVAPSIVDKMKEAFKAVKAQEGLHDLSKGISFELRRSDGKGWKEPAANMAQIRGSIDTTAMQVPKTVKLTGYAVFLLEKPAVTRKTQAATPSTVVINK